MASDGLERLGRFGPFFAVQTLDAADLDAADLDAADLDAADLDAADLDAAEAGWIPVAAMSEDAALLGRRIASVRQALAASAQLDASDPVLSRVAVSITQLGLSARLIAVALGAIVDGLEVPTLDRLVFQDRLGGPYPLGVKPASGSAEVPVPAWPESVLTLVRPIAEAVLAGGHGLSAKIVRGNVASALAGAAAMIALAEPALGETARARVRQALLLPELAGTGSYVDGAFRRNSCCLIYRLAEEPIFCGDCVLAAA